MSDQTNCIECGAKILATTAAENAGRCVTCAPGTRKQIEGVKSWQKSTKAFRKSPPWIFWTLLVKKNFDDMSEAEKQYFAVACLRGEVLNGGFDQYFHNSSVAYCRAATLGLTAMGAVKSLEILHAALTSVFGADIPQRDLPEVAARALADPGVSMRMDELDKRFWNDPDDLWSLMMAFGAHQGFFPQPAA